MWISLLKCYCFRFSALAHKLTVPSDTPEIDATNLIINPGLVDLSAFSNAIDQQGLINPKKLHDASVSAAMNGVTTMSKVQYWSQIIP